jgi:hypothetical protein
MSDVLEELLAARLHMLGETVDDELSPPADLELQVARRRRKTSATRRWASLSVAALIVAAATTVAVVHGTTGHGSIQISSTATTAAPLPPDHLAAGTTILSAGGRWVQTLGATGHGNATMVAVAPGHTITYARATDDHREIWYLTSKNGTHACGDVVRADLDSGQSTIVTHAESFDVSPDGSRLALFGAGDLARDHCTPVKAGASGRVAVVDLANHSSSISVPRIATTPATTFASTTSLRWSPDGTYVAAVSCGAQTCAAFSRIAVPAVLGAQLLVDPVSWSAYPGPSIRSAAIEFGPGGLYMLKRLNPVTGKSTATDRIDRVDPLGEQTAVTVFSSNKWNVTEVVPTAVGTYVVAAPVSPKAAKLGLYLVEAGRLVLVRALNDPGTLVPVPPLAVAG